MSMTFEHGDMEIYVSDDEAKHVAKFIIKQVETAKTGSPEKILTYAFKKLEALKLVSVSDTIGNPQSIFCTAFPDPPPRESDYEEEEINDSDQTPLDDSEF